MQCLHRSPKRRRWRCRRKSSLSTHTPTTY
jgi:hypothetical protein